MQLEYWLRRRDVQRWLAILLLAVIAAVTGKVGERVSPNSPASGTIEGYPQLVDGDSFGLGTGEVRLKGIDAPEGRQTCVKDGRTWACGEAARAELKRLIGTEKIVCRVSERDQHDRALAYCTAGGRDLNAAMVSSGFAFSYGGYVKEETAARLARRGLWGSEFQKPREWRRDHGIGGRGST